MSLSPLWQAGPVIAAHALLALAAFVLGLAQLALAKGGRAHRWRGRAWVGVMAVVALSALFINERGRFGPFSWIHLLVPVTLYGLVSGIRDIRRGDVRGHAVGMAVVFVSALAIAGGFTFAPGRRMHEVVFGPP
jgi:uncharacterized membrane protein